MSEARAFESVPAGFKAGHAAGGDWARVVKACFDSLGELPVGANLGFVYATDPLAADLGSILTFLRERSGIEHWVGTVGLGVAASGVEYHDQPALTVLVGVFPENAFRVLTPITDSGGALADKDHVWAADRAPLFGVVHGDPRNPHMAEMVAGLSAKATCFLVGGLSASRDELPQIADRVTEGGLSGVLFSDQLSVAAGLTQGCMPIGPVRRITESEQNVVKAIDGRPALEVFKEDIGELLARDLRRIAGYIYVGFPVTGSDTGDYLVRNITGIDGDRQWLAFSDIDLVGQDRTLRFCRRDHDAAVKDLKRMLADLKVRAGGKAKAGLYFSCLERGEALFGSNSEELKLVRQVLGDIPLVGYFANGEISNDRLYGYTGVLALFL